jgi:molecular chaperone DnaJ
MAQNYYSILGVDKSASQDDIKKAFRKLAHTYHPDKNQGNKEAEAKFKEINEAYQVLSDEQKRKQYDQFGSTSSSQGFGGGQYSGGFGGFEASGFEGFDFSNMGDIFSEFFGGAAGSRVKRGSDMEVTINISLRESYFGVEREIRINKISVCDACTGSRTEKGTKTTSCNTCKGSGRVSKVTRSFMGNFNQIMECATCYGTGTVPEQACKKCKGAGVVDKTETIKIPVPSGIENGNSLRMPGAGEAILGGQTGDLYIRIIVDRDPVWKRIGMDIERTLDIKLTEALLGTTLTVDTFGGKVDLHVPPGTNTGDVLKIEGRGFASGNRKGALLFKMHISVPKKLSSKAKEYIHKLQEEGI